MDTLKLKVIVGSTRPGRFGEKPAAWIFDQAKKKGGVDVELLDLRDYQMPFFDEPVSPSYKTEPYAHEAVQRWTAKIAEADGFVIVSPEYNHGYPGVLKNAMDYVHQEWNNKAVGFVSYGSVGGGRVVEQLRLVAVELQMAPIRNAIHIQWPTYLEIAQDQSETPQALADMNDKASGFLDQLIWWTTALKNARNG